MATIFITGGARGIGLALAQRYAEAGDRVLLGVRDTEAARRHAPFAEAVPLDVVEPESIDALPARLHGRAIDLLVNNAGVIGPDHQSTLDMDFAGFADTLAVNTLGPLRVIQALLPNLRAASNARVAVISSRMGALSSSASGYVAYRASKAAVNKVFQCLAADLAGEGIAVAVVHPGWVRTDMGGAGADVAPEDSAAGIHAVLERLTLATTGRFWNYDGSETEW
jgi:NAD(P)-dependent dehydrogenase (short-subunit alcohol dehydrogenase family)